MGAENNPEVMPALRAILVYPNTREREMILSGEMTLTVRKGYRDYRKGPVMLCCHVEPWAVMATIVEVRHCLLHQVTDEEVRATGINGGITDLWTKLRRFHPEMTLLDPVTVARWNNLKGKLAEEARKVSTNF